MKKFIFKICYVALQRAAFFYLEAQAAGASTLAKTSPDYETKKMYYNIASRSLAVMGDINLLRAREGKKIIQQLP